MLLEFPECVLHFHCWWSTMWGLSREVTAMWNVGLVVGIWGDGFLMWSEIYGMYSWRKMMYIYMFISLFTLSTWYEI